MPKDENATEEALTKSKSLPPRQRAKSPRTKEEEDPAVTEQREFEEKLKGLSGPERERLIARRRKFQGREPVVPSEGKKISLKKDEARAPETDDVGDMISLSVEDTLDMFDEKPAKKRMGRKEGE